MWKTAINGIETLGVGIRTPLSSYQQAAAEQRVRAFLLGHGHHIEAMRLLARIGIAELVLKQREIIGD